jgi:LysM repeat protein
MYWEDVAVVNGYGEHTVLQIGQVIKVPVVEEVVAPETTQLVNTRQATVGPMPAEGSAGNFENYTLMKFDPNRPAQVAGVQTEMAQTGVGGPSTEVTQVAMAKSEGATSTVLAQHAQQQASSLYVVAPGDTIISIASKHNIEWGQLLSLNGLNENSVLQPGQMIQVR